MKLFNKLRIFSRLKIIEDKLYWDKKEKDKIVKTLKETGLYKDPRNPMSISIGVSMDESRYVDIIELKREFDALKNHLNLRSDVIAEHVKYTRQNKDNE